MRLRRFQVGESGGYAFKDRNDEAKIYYDKLGKKKIYCDLHKRTQLMVSIFNEFDVPYCPKCVKDEIIEDGYIRIPYIGGLGNE